MWDAVKPPPPVRPRNPRVSAIQKRILYGLLIACILSAGSWIAYSYYASAPERAEAEFQQGMKLMGPGKYAEAIAHFDRAMAILGSHSNAHLQRGLAEQVLGRNEDALADFDAAISLDPKLAEAYTARGTILRDRGDARAAIEAFTKSVEIRPTMDGYYQRGQLWSKLGEHQKAIEDFDRAIAHDRLAPYLYRARGESRRVLGDLDGYREDRDTAKSIERKF
jgi:tetratricopeptide (TPR) repeat protein